MEYFNTYKSPLGTIYILSDEESLTGLYFQSQIKEQNLLNEQFIVSNSYKNSNNKVIINPHISKNYTNIANTKDLESVAKNIKKNNISKNFINQTSQNNIKKVFQNQVKEKIQNYSTIEATHDRNKVKAPQNLSIFESTKMWLDMYFDNQIPSFTPPLKAAGSSFALSIWEILLKIPYGKSSTYGAIAKIIATQRGLKKMSAQAVGGAVGANPIAIIIPCHRVIGSNGALTGYAGGLDIKKKLLEIEGFKL